ncbi:GTPase-like protein [Candidatus Vecturithrix granuli]|uniref:GTPase-like protein n=1 Tax=Vecturithrix granuli TaxID=1499967 RepID=A0A081C0A2_VECG1|nr:GTPase-like protein [Candidatus Vecturithrix granuli]
MALFNYANREITAKIVYYGAGVCGKTTSLEYIHERIAPSQRGRLLSLATETDRTIFFDLLPLKLGEISGFKIRFQLYTVPGQVKYNKTRKLVLQGADAIVFVADSQKSRREANIESFKNLQQNLREQNRRLEDIPLVYAFNKRDLADILSIEELNKDINLANLSYFPTIATKGVGVMESLEAISKQALHDMEQRLTASSPIEEEEEQEEDLTLSDDLMDLTGEEEFGFSHEDLGSLELESDLTEELAPENATKFSLETRPIGYDNDIPLEEFEIRDEELAQTGTLKESEFFNLKDVEEQALRELDDFLEGKTGDEEALLNFEDTEFPDLSTTAAEEEQAFSAFGFDKEFGHDDSLSPDEEQQFTSFTPGQKTTEKEERVSMEEENVLEFALDMETDESSLIEFERADTLSHEETLQVEESLDFTLNDQPPEVETELTFSLEEETPESAESLAYELESPENRADMISDDFDLGNAALTTDEEDETLSGLELDEESAAKGQIEALDLSDSDLDLTFGDEGEGIPDTEDFPAFNLDDETESGESASYGEEELVSFTLDEEPSRAELEDQLVSLRKDKGILGLSYGKEALSQKAQETEFADFRITDSVKFEMQVGEEISSGTPFEQQLEQLSSKELFTSDEETREDEFQPVTGELTEEEQFQVISDEWTRFMVLAKFFYHRGEHYRAQHAVSENVLALMMYFTAVETALKAVASKYETCNPALASFHLLLESIEEETQKPVAGAKSIRNNILIMKNRVQLEGGYPDDEECELAARISERFLSSLAQDFLTIDFDKLSPVLPRPETDK